MLLLHGANLFSRYEVMLHFNEKVKKYLKATTNSHFFLYNVLSDCHWLLIYPFCKVFIKFHISLGKTLCQTLQ